MSSLSSVLPEDFLTGLEERPVAFLNVCVTITHHTVLATKYYAHCKRGIDVWLVGSLNLFNVELSPRTYWWTPRSEEVREDGDYNYT